MTSIRIAVAVALTFGVVFRMCADEFVGPFPSWGNVKTDFGAVGDGKADDTAALQRGLDALQGRKTYVLYLPAGIYRLTDTLSVSGQGILNCMVIGEDPKTTILKWDGPVNGTMLRGTGGLSYMKMARLTWDGAGRALAAVDHAWILPPEGNICGTHNTHEDEIFQDVGFGIRAGEHSQKGSGMDAETHVQRCKFIRCWNAGLSIETFNALDWWLTNCEFIDCRVGAANAADGEYGGGHFHIYHSLFRNSSETDVKIGHCSHFSIRFNTSIGSRAFLLAIRPNGVISSGMWAGSGSGGWSPSEKWGATITLQSNTILDTREPASIRVFNHGPLFLLDNTIRTRRDVRAGPVVFLHTPLGNPDLISIGNTFTVEEAVDSDARALAFDNRVVEPGAIPDSRVTMPPAAPKAERPVFEVTRGASTEEILRVLADAMRTNGSRPVVHFPAGDYPVTQTLAVAANSDVQLVGDAWGSRLHWKGPDGRPLLHLAGPAKATLRDLLLGGGAAPLLLVTDCDQPGARVHAEHLTASSPGYGLVAENVDNLRIESFAHMNYGSMIVGGPRTAAGEKTFAHLAIIGGASSNDETLYAVRSGGRMAVWDTWYEGSPPRFLKLEGRGALTLSGGAYYCGNRKEEIPELEVGNFTGRFLCQGLNAAGSARMQAQETARDCSLLFLGNSLGASNAFINRSSTSRMGFLGNRGYVKTENGKTDIGPYENQGIDSPEFIREMLRDLRAIVPDWNPAPTGKGVTDLRLYRVKVEGGSENGGIVLRGDK